MIPHTSGPKQRRADATRNTERIVDAAISQLRVRPDATMASIAREAGLGRVTIYGHFASRRDIVEAAMTRVMAEANGSIASASTDPDPTQAMTRTLTLSWQLMNRSRMVAIAATDELSATQLRDLHTVLTAQMTALVTRGQAERVFRPDLPAWWLVAAIHHLFHAAAEFATTGTGPTHAQHHLVETVLAVLEHPNTFREKTVQ
ncbi:TetR/AcrR family transcriptional regulator [Rhodococcus sp. IEGM 1330]|uniref:TetR/AcrR family transcriptional regulator n=1 Tax=Rhodococcus sp. IEGM 1330 TaxID=3082225 RepID=UPI0029534979|nr:TetR/AcrR family transcriptional regulator [Rhodococcus sp. IEGM 1330]MDV8022663.1 TetR/AcrR family transcriptional regulator [Rhodococcus sp. IEGM 1330]